MILLFSGEIICEDCVCTYCSTCFKIFHSKGHKKKHKNDFLLDKVTINNNNNSNKNNNNNNANSDDIASTIISISNDNITNIDVNNIPPVTCIVCHDKADQQCVQCRDFYCSRTWMGNPGCFLHFHHQGNRCYHTTEVIAIIFIRLHLYFIFIRFHLYFIFIRFL